MELGYILSQTKNVLSVNEGPTASIPTSKRPAPHRLSTLVWLDFDNCTSLSGFNSSTTRTDTKKALQTQLGYRVVGDPSSVLYMIGPIYYPGNGCNE